MNKSNPVNKMLKNIITRIARERCWLVEISEKKCPHLITASINPKNWLITFNIDPDTEILLGEAGMNKNEQQLLIRGIVEHEMGHWRVCPYDKTGHYLIVNSVASVVSKKKTNSLTDHNDLNKLIHFLVNIIADIIVDTVLAWKDKNSLYADGQALFFIKEFVISKQTNEAYIFFIWLNMALWGNKTQYQTEISCLVDQKLLDGSFPQSPILNDWFPDYENSVKMITWLKNKLNWPELSRKSVSKSRKVSPAAMMNCRLLLCSIDRLTR